MASHLVQILLPQYDNEGEPFGQDFFAATRRELIERFGGLTAHIRAPARGLWKTDDGAVARDDIIIFEVMTDALEPRWWGEYKHTLEVRFRQDAIVVRAMPVEML